MPAFIANIPNALQIGDQIDIGGKIKENARKMSINLCAQDGEEPKDVVLHFDVRFYRDNIISLSRKNGLWIGSGNYDTNYNMFVPGTLFRIVFEIKDNDVITIHCQGKFHSNFLPKIPISMARYIVAWADIDRITHCYFQSGNQVLIPTGTDLKASKGDENIVSVNCAMRSRLSPPPVQVGDSKQNGKPKNDCSSPKRHSLDSADNDKQQGRNENRSQKICCGALCCHPNKHHIADDPCTAKRCLELTRRHKEQDIGVMDDQTSGEVSEEIANKEYKNDDSSVLGSEVVLPYLGIKKRVRREKFRPFFKEKTTRK